jgi:hypothetical protein
MTPLDKCEISMRRIVFCLLLACAVQPALAAQYVCSTTLRLPGAAGSLGTNGAVGITTYSGPFCTGNAVAIRKFCGWNNSSSSCAVGIQLGEATINAIFSSAQAAARDGNEVSFQVASCKVTGLPDCVNDFTVFAQ